MSETPVHTAHATNVQEFIENLDASNFEAKIGLALSDVAAGVVDHDQVGSVTIEFKMKRIGNSASVVVAHKLTTKRPTAKGERTETNTTSTPQHVGPGGKMTLYPMGADTSDMFNRKEDLPEKA